MTQVQRNLTNAVSVLIDTQERLETQGRLTDMMCARFREVYSIVKRIEETVDVK